MDEFDCRGLIELLSNFLSMLMAEFLENEIHEFESIKE
jgi:hypothetical protein